MFALDASSQSIFYDNVAKRPVVVTLNLIGGRVDGSSINEFS